MSKLAVDSLIEGDGDPLEELKKSGILRFLFFLEEDIRENTVTFRSDEEQFYVKSNLFLPDEIP